MQALSESEDQQAHRLHWSRFRRQHQGRAQQFHQLRRARQAPALSVFPPAALPVPGVPPLTDALPERIRPLLPPQKRQKGQTASDPRLMLEGMLWVARTGSSWRELPERFGPWAALARRYHRWAKQGLWTRIVQIVLPAHTLFFSSS